LPGTLRQANTTFHNLRPALDDLTPADQCDQGPARRTWPRFLRQLHPVLTRSRPRLQGPETARVNLNGKSNDLADATGFLTALQKAGRPMRCPSPSRAMQDSEPILSFLRPYTPDLTSGIAHLNQTGGYYDANGHYVRVQPAGNWRIPADNPL